MQGEWTQFNPANDDDIREKDPVDRSFALWATGLLLGAVIGWLIPTLLSSSASSWMGLGALFGLMVASWFDNVRRNQQEPDSS
jgi:hypothetical protein